MCLNYSIKSRRGNRPLINITLLHNRRKPAQPVPPPPAVEALGGGMIRANGGIPLRGRGSGVYKHGVCAANSILKPRSGLRPLRGRERCGIQAGVLRSKTPCSSPQGLRPPAVEALGDGVPGKGGLSPSGGMKDAYTSLKAPDQPGTGKPAAKKPAPPTPPYSSSEVLRNYLGRCTQPSRVAPSPSRKMYVSL
jgi:hypothetical protein